MRCDQRHEWKQFAMHFNEERNIEIYEKEEDTDFGFESEVHCNTCDTVISYDECVHYEEFLYLCNGCGKGLDNICKSTTFVIPPKSTEKNRRFLSPYN